MKYILCCFLAVILLQRVSAQTGVHLLYEEVVNQNGIQDEIISSRVVYSKPNYTITSINIIPKDEDTKQSKNEIIEGGIGSTNAIIQVTSAKGKGNYFSVEIYGIIN